MLRFSICLTLYKRVRSRPGKNFSYKNIKTVYTIVLFESSPAAFSDFPDTYIHNFKQKSDTGIEIDLLQRYIFIPLDKNTVQYMIDEMQNEIHGMKQQLNDKDDTIKLKDNEIALLRKQLEDLKSHN